MSELRSGRPLRVLAVTNMYPTADDPSFGVFVRTQMDSIAAEGAEVRVEFLDGRNTKMKYVTAAARIRRLVRSGAHDLVHAHYGLSGFVAAFQPVPLVVSYCGDDLLGSPDGAGGKTPKSRVQVLVSNMAAVRADQIICKSAGLRASLVRKADRAKAHVIANGVDTVLFSPGPRAQARGILGLDAHERLVLFPNRSRGPRKRLDLAEGAISVLARQGLAARLWCVTGIAQRDLATCYRAADCLLLTSDHEGSPNVVKEALCCDIPVVSVDVGDVRSWLDLAHGCRLVKREPEAIARGIAEVLQGPRQVDGSRVREELALPKVARRVLDVYREAIRMRAP